MVAAAAQQRRARARVYVCVGGGGGAPEEDEARVCREGSEAEAAREYRTSVDTRDTMA